MISIIKDPAAVSEYLSAVQEAADQQKDRFGFLAKSAYEQSCLMGKLWVAVDENSKSYAGHLLFGGTYPTLRIGQLNVSPNWRRCGVGKRLVAALKSHGETKGYSSISARVAEDLRSSNDFWASAGFGAKSLVDGGKTTKRKIIIRVLQLEVPTLFDALEESRADHVVEHIKFRSGPIHRKRTYAIDLNVYLDITKGRQWYDDAATVIRGSFSGNFELYVTEELITELGRGTVDGQSDPIHDFAKNLAVLPIVQKDVLEPITTTLRQILFPDRSETRSGAIQDISDLHHLGMAIHHELDGFITREKAVLRGASAVQGKFGLEVLSPSDFSSPNDNPTTIKLNPIVSRSEFPNVSEFLEENRADIRSFLEGLGINKASIVEALKPGNDREPTKRYVLKIRDEVIGFSSWRVPAPSDNEVDCFLFVKENRQGAVQFTEHILESFGRDVSFDRGRCLYLLISANQTHAYLIAGNSLYTPVPERGMATGLVCLMKYAVSGVVTPDRWPVFVQLLKNLAGVQLEDKMPDYRPVQNDGIKVLKDNNKIRFLDLFEFETYFTPVLVLFPKRKGVLVPIRPAFSEDLLGKADDQQQLFGNSEALLKVERTYFRSPSGSAAARKGDPIIFYSSRRAKEAIGCARITFSEVVNVESINAQTSSTGVLSSEELSEMADDNGNVHMISFDGFQEFIKPVGLEKLKSFGAGRQNFITLEKLEAATLRDICAWGLGYVEE